MDTKQLGQNFTVKEQKVVITPNEWFIPIEKAYPALEEEYKRIELDKNLTTAMRNELFAQLILVWGGYPEFLPRNFQFRRIENFWAPVCRQALLRSYTDRPFESVH